MTMDHAASPVVERIARTTRHTPRATAIEYRGQPRTYAELWATSGRIADNLLAGGIAPGDAVVVASTPGPLWAATILGIWRAHGVYVPVDVAFPPLRIASIIDDCAAQIVLGERPLPAGAKPPNVPEVRITDLTAAAPPQPRLQLASANCHRDNSGHLGEAACVIYTSGSTGVPKGVVLTQRGLAHRMRSLAAMYELTCTDRIAQLASPCFDVSLWEVLLPAEVGGCLAIPTPAQRTGGPALARFLGDRRITVVTCTPSMLAELPQVDLPNLRLIIVGGEELHPAPLRGWIDRHQVANAYGPTEATIEATVCLDLAAGRAVTIGRPIPGVEVFILDEHQRPVPDGMPGELYLAGEGLALGYLGDPVLTDQRFPTLVINGRLRRLYRTGDLVRRGDNDELHFLGRSDRQLNLGGVRVEPAEIETLLTQVPGVRAAAVVPAYRRGHAILAGHVAGDGINPDEVQRHLRARLPARNVPTTITCHDRLPLTVTGKIDRRALAARDDPGGEPSGEPSAAALTEPLPAELSALWAQLTGTRPAHGDQDFFASGGHSLAALRLLYEVNLRFGTGIDLDTFMADPTVAGLQYLIRGGSTDTVATNHVPDHAAPKGSPCLPP